MEARAPRLLLAAALVLLFAACFAGDTTGLPDESRLQLGIVVIAGTACAAWLYGGQIRLAASPAAWVGVALLGAFAAWTAVSITWSVAPDLSWIELNRGIAYTLAVVLGIALGASLPRARERWANAFAAFVGLVALYAIAGKTVPGFTLFGLLNLDHAGPITRLRAPLEYWNALALLCVFGIPVTLRLAADPERRAGVRLLALTGVYLLVVVIGLTYSRGGVLATVVALATFLALTTHRLRALTLFGVAAMFATLPLTLALTSPDLTTNSLPVEQREDAALLVLVALAVGAVFVVGLGLLMARLERRRVLTPQRGRRWGRALAIGCGGLFALGALNAVATGAVGDAVDQFTTTEAQEAGLTDPNRLLNTNSGNRWTWWQEAAGAWSDEPLVGWGAGSFPVTHERYRTKPLPVRQPHNVPLQFLAETGLIGALLGLGGLVALLVAGVARTRETQWRLEGGTSRPAAAALLAIPAAWLVHSLYDWDWDIPAVTLPMLIATGVLVARVPRRPPEAGGPGMRALGFGGVVGVLVLVTVSAFLPALAESKSDAAIAAVGKETVSDEELADAAAKAELAAQLNPLAVDPLFKAAAIAERRGRVDEARRIVLRALDRQPESVDGWLALARLELQRLDRAGVREAAARALELDPLNPAVFALARAAQNNSVLPGESATATGSPLPTQVPVTDPAAIDPAAGLPGVVPSPGPQPAPTQPEPPLPSGSPFPTPTPYDPFK